MSRLNRLVTSWQAAAILLLLALTAGCGTQALNGSYGKARGVDGQASVNGTGALASMFEEAGYQLVTRNRLSPRLQDFDVIVWAPDAFDLPGPPQRAFLEQWLSEEDGRTLIYIGRDYDAVPDYWRKVQSQNPPPEQAIELRRRAARSQAAFDRARAAQQAQGDCRWFAYQRDAAPRQVQSVEGEWSAEGAQPNQVDIRLEGRLGVPSPPAKKAGKADDYPLDHAVLLESEGDILVLRSRDSFLWPRSQILTVANGSFLLNLPLVQPGHRQLAARLVEACGDRRRVAFIESGPQGPPVYDSEPDDSPPTGFEALQEWPTNMILMHLLVLLILLCAMLYPIFGRPVTLPANLEAQTDQPTASPHIAAADFGRHLTALGKMLEQAGDRVHAMNQIRQYHDHSRRDSGSRHSRWRSGGGPAEPPASAAPRPENL